MHKKLTKAQKKEFDKLCEDKGIDIPFLSKIFQFSTKYKFKTTHAREKHEYTLYHFWKKIT